MTYFRWKDTQYFVDPYVCRVTLEVRWDIKALQMRRHWLTGQSLYRIRDVLYGADRVIVESFAAQHRICFAQLDQTERLMQDVADAWRRAKTQRTSASVTPHMGMSVLSIGEDADTAL